jgi:zinc transporter ZupT
MNWNLLWNVLSVLLGAVAVYVANVSSILAIALAFLSGLIVALSARLDMGIVKEKNYDTQK